MDAKQHRRQQDLALVGAIFFLLPALTGLQRFIQVDRFGPENVVIGSFFGALIMLGLSGYLFYFGFFGRRKDQKERDTKPQQ